MLSVLQSDSEAADEGLNTYSAKVDPVYSHPVAEIASFFGRWNWYRPAWSTPGSGTRAGNCPTRRLGPVT